MSHIAMPDDATIQTLWQKYETPPNVIRHCQTVARLVEQVCAAYEHANVSDATLVVINTPLARAAALLHDAKRHQPHHAAAAANSLEQDGYPEVANIVRHHDFRYIVSKSLKTIEEKIVNYADKRVIHDQIVTVNERIDDLKQRYANNAKRIESYREPVKTLERELLDEKESYIRLDR